MPCNYKDYPPNFRSEIRPRILERDGHRCKHCGLRNYSWILRHEDGTAYPPGGWTDAELAEYGAGYIPEKYDGIEKWTKIVLTIAHLDNPDPWDCRDENLASLCQRCHNVLDAPLRAKNAAATRARKKREKIESEGQLALNLEV